MSPEAQDVVQACPECDCNRIHARRWGEGGKAVPQSERWRCSGCGAEFGDPVERLDARLATAPGVDS